MTPRDWRYVCGSAGCDEEADGRTGLCARHSIHIDPRDKWEGPNRFQGAMSAVVVISATVALGVFLRIVFSICA